MKYFFLIIFALILNLQTDLCFSQSIDQTILLLRQQIDPLLQENERLMFQIESLNREFSLLREESVFLSRENQDKKDLVIRLETAVENEDKYASLLKSNLAALRQDVVALQRRHQELERENKELEIFGQRIRERSGKLLDQVQKKAAILDRSKKDVNSQQLKLEEEILILEKEIRDFQELQERVQDVIIKKKEKYAQLRKYISEREAEKKEISLEVLQAESYLNKNKQYLKEAEREKISQQVLLNKTQADFFDQKMKLTYKIQSLKGQLQEVNQEIAQATESLGQALAKAEDKIQKQIDEVQFENLLLTHQVLMLHRDIEEKQKEKQVFLNLLRDTPDEVPTPPRSFERSILLSPDASAVFVKPQDFLKLPDILKE